VGTYKPHRPLILNFKFIFLHIFNSELPLIVENLAIHIIYHFLHRRKMVHIIFKSYPSAHNIFIIFIKEYLAQNEFSASLDCYKPGRIKAVKERETSRVVWGEFP